MTTEHAKSLIDRRFHVLVLDVPSLLRAPGEAPRLFCRRLEHLLDREVRVVLAVFDDEGQSPEELCKAIGGLSRVFLFAWTAQGVIFGFDQWGLAAKLTRGVIEAPDAAAAMILDVVAEPADIRASSVLVIGEHFGPGGRDRVFTGNAFAGARLIALSDTDDVPPGVRRVPAGAESATALLDTLLWVWN
jgi:hypothetical protein